jgi:iron complex outermembrane receptor protein
MRLELTLLASVAAGALLTVTASPAAAQSAPAAPTKSGAASADQGAEVGEVVVTGLRASLQSAQEIKETKTQIVDSIVADDIGKLPDVTVSDALQRITGVQISRDLGEGGGTIAIRGLPQIETTLDGREAFTAGGGRSFNFEDVPSQLVAGVDVYKTSSPDLIEGGLGGLIDVRTHKPFDFKGLTVSGNIAGRYSDLADKTRPEGSLLVSDRWDTSIGEVGALVVGSYQKRAYRQDLDSIGAPAARTDLIPGQTVTAPNGIYLPQIIGERKRIGFSGTLQWRPTNELEFYAQGNYSNLKTQQDQRGMLITTNRSAADVAAGRRAPILGSFTTIDGSSDFATGSYANVPVNAFGTTRDTTDKNTMLAVGGSWNQGPFTVKGDISYTKSVSDLRYAELDLITNAPVFNQSNLTSIPSATISGVDLTNPANYTFGPLTLSENHYSGTEKAYRLDGEYKFGGGIIRSIGVGVRYGDREAEFTPIRFFVTPTTQAIAGHPELWEQTPYPNFYSKTESDVAFPRNYLSSVTDQLRNNFDGIRSALGIATTPSVSALAVFNVGEKTTAGYVVANYEFNLGLPVDGAIGLRVVNTDETLVGERPLFTGSTQTGFSPLNINNSYTDVLPSLNARIHLRDDLQLRLAASKTITRPDFSQLSPSLTLVPANAMASSGNPDLQPLKSDNLDASLEWYFSKSGSLYAAAFYKKVKGFIQTTVTPNVLIDGIAYNLSQPSNGNNGKVKGVELGYQQFFDFLPAPFDGLGVQANYTYVDSSAPTAIAGLSTALPQLSKNSYNLVGFYEKGKISTRIAYNWRSSFYNSLYTGLGAIAPVYTKGYGWLDASFSYDITPQLTATLEGTNLLRTQLENYIGRQSLPNSRSIDDRQFLAGLRFKF